MLVFHFSDLFKIYQYKYKLNINCLSIQTYAAKDLKNEKEKLWMRLLLGMKPRRTVLGRESYRN